MERGIPAMLRTHTLDSTTEALHLRPNLKGETSAYNHLPTVDLQVGTIFSTFRSFLLVCIIMGYWILMEAVILVVPLMGEHCNNGKRLPSVL